MAISLGSNLALHTRLPLDDRTIMETIEEMKDYPENFLPDIAYCFVKSDGKMYVFNRENESTELTGKWRVLEGSGGGTAEVPIEKIKVNGELQTPVNKVVDITVPDAYDDTDIRTELANKSDTDHTHTTVNGHTVESDVPVDAKFTDTVYDDTQVKTQIQTVANGLMDSVGYSADYKSIDIIAKNSEKKSIDVAPIISHASITELSDVDTTNKATGKALVYNAITSKHEYADVSGTDEKVKMDASGDSKYLGELLDNVTITNENGELKVKKLDGQEVTITEINYLKGLTMNVMDLVNMFSNGGVKIINTPVATYAELLTLDKSSFIEGISYLVYVLADENHDNAKTTYLVDKDSETPTYFGFADSHRDFTTNPIDLATEITGKLGIANMDSDAIKALFTVDDTYKTETATNNAFSTHGAKALYDELLLAIGGKANDSDFTTHRDDTSIHVSTTEKETWNKAQENVIETVNVNGSALTPTDKAVDITVPTTVAELTDSSSYAKTTEIPTTLPANGGNSDTVNNHTVKSDVPENAVFTDTVYDDTEVKESITELSSNLDTLEFGEVAGSKNLVYKTIKNANIETNGTIIATTDATDIHVAKVESGKTYTFTADSTVYAFYSVEPKLTIQSYDSSRVTSGSRTITIPSGVSYLAFRTLNTYTTVMVEEGTTATAYEPYIPSVKMLADKIYNSTKVDVVLYDKFDIKVDNIQNRLYLLGNILYGSLYLRFDEEHDPFTQGFDWVDIGDVPQIVGAPQLYNCISYAEILDDNDYAKGDVRIYEGKLGVRIRKQPTVSRNNWYAFYQAVCMKVELAE